MNCEMQEDVKLRLSFEGFGSMEGIAWRELYDDDPYADGYKRQKEQYAKSKDYNTPEL